jgi:hypothetical protein
MIIICYYFFAFQTRNDEANDNRKQGLKSKSRDTHNGEISSKGPNASGGPIVPSGLDVGRGNYDGW